MIFDKNLGWDIVKNGSAMDSLYVSNNHGIRRNKNIGVNKKISITSYGDSFVHCDDVTNDRYMAKPSSAAKGKRF